MENSLSALLCDYLDQAKGHIESLNSTHDVDDAIHDFRLNIRRLRSWLKICRKHKIANLTRKDRRRLGKLVDITNESRDLDVSVQLLDEYMESLNLTAHVDATLLMEKWQKQCSLSHKSTLQDALSAFHKVEPKLRALITALREQEGKDALNLVSFVEIVMPQIAKELDGLLDAIKSSDDIETIHRARILAKVLRYAGEPFANLDAAFALLVKELHSLQDVIGGLRDAQIFAHRLDEDKHESPALKAIYDRNQSQILLFFSTFEAAYLKPQGSRFENKIKLLFARILDRP